MNRPHRILIVDDDRDTLSNLSDILTDIGYQTETASHGRLALEKMTLGEPYSESPFDVCLLDFRMPDMDGAELLSRLRSIFPTLRAIMITAYAGDDGVQRAKDAGMYRVLRKPVDIKTLLGVIDEALALAD